jgi:ligand-binding sensor domain-containing protein/AraC-like DNA-binding protein
MHVRVKSADMIRLYVIIALIAVCSAAAKNTVDTAWTDYKHPIKFGRLSVEDGLSQSSVFAIHQDSTGFMWFGTEDGLNRFDGYHFKVFRPHPGNLHGINDNIIHCIFEDRSGTLWIGTNSGGLNRYDKQTEQFFHYDYDVAADGSRPSKTVNCIFQDSQGTIWLGTGGAGLTRMITDGKNNTAVSFINYYVDEDNPHSLSDYNVVSIFEDKNQVLWAGTDGGGLNRLNLPPAPGESLTFTRYTENPALPQTAGLTHVMAINQDQQGLLWLGTQNGLISFDPKTNQFKRYTAKPNDWSTISHNYVRTIYKCRNGMLWIGTDGGGISKLITEKDKPPVFIHYQTDLNNPDGLSCNAVESIYEDRSGVIWIGLYRHGLNTLLPNKTAGTSWEKPQFIHYQTIANNANSLSNNAVNAICQDSRGYLWVGTDGGGLNRITPAHNFTEALSFRHFLNNPLDAHSLSDNIVTCLAQDQQGDVWIGTYTGGLNRISASAAAHAAVYFVRYQLQPENANSLSYNFVMTLCEGKDGYLWIGTIDGGLNRLHWETGEFKRYMYNATNPKSLSDNNVFAIHQDQAGTLWVGTMAGLNRLVGEEFICFRHQPGNLDSISHDFIRVIFEDHDKTLWLGTNGGGLNKLINNNSRGEALRFRCYTEADGLANNVIVGILEDGKGNLWISTKKGLSRFNPATNEFKNFEKSDGLQSDEFNRGAYFMNRHGEMFFGGNNGFNIFHPDHIAENTIVPAVVLTDFRIFNRSLPIGKLADGRTILTKSISETNRIKLSYKDYLFSIHFAALDYVSPSKNQYAYKLEGLDNQWNPIGNQNFVTYTTLPHGHYVLNIKGSNNDGLWNDQAISLKLIITPPFWKTWWFYSIMVLAAFFIILGIHLFRVRQIIKKLEKKYEKTAIKPEQADAYLKVLLNYMKLGKPYLDPNLNSQKLSKLVAIPYHYLSQIINNKLNKIFFDFINEYRIADAIKKLKDPKESQKSIQQLAQEVGFNSQSAFNRAFKKITSQTPSDYVNLYRIEEAARRLLDPAEKNKSIQQISQEVGFSSQSSFNRAFKKITNTSPAEFRKKK